jgi:hypothetical protein
MARGCHAIASTPTVLVDFTEFPHIPGKVNPASEAASSRDASPRIDMKAQAT